jgi:ABC-2 type transport system permease protein
MRVYWEVAKRSFRQHATYRGATIAGIITNTAFGFIQAYVLLAVFAQRVDVNGFDAVETTTFVFAAQGFLMVVSAFADRTIATRVKSGDVVADLYRPVDYQGYWLAHTLGRATFHFFARGIPPFLAGALVLDLQLPGSPATWLAFLLATAGAVVLSYTFAFLYNLLAFWVIDIRGVIQLATTLLLFFSGSIIPLFFFPGWLESLARMMPFAGMIQLPVEVFLGRHAGAGLVAVLAFQAAWIVFLGSVGRALLRGAMNRVVIQGG